MARHEFSGLIQMCTDLEQRSMPYSDVQQCMVQELHKCSKAWRKPSRIQNFSEWPIPHFYYMIILNPNLVGRRELGCN